MVAKIIPAWQFRLIRRFPRMPFVIPVEVFSAGKVFTAQSQNLSLGGMLLERTCDLPRSERLLLRFPLRTGPSIIVVARVVHCRPGVRAGLEFINLESATRDALRQSITTEQSGQRRSIRIPQRLYLYLQWERDGILVRQKAETVLLSRHGCLLLTAAEPPSNHARVTILWPDAGAEISARVVSAERDMEDMFKIALEFAEDADFWGINFASERTDPTWLMG